MIKSIWCDISEDPTQSGLLTCRKYHLGYKMRLLNNTGIFMENLEKPKSITRTPRENMWELKTKSDVFAAGKKETVKYMDNKSLRCRLTSRKPQIRPILNRFHTTRLYKKESEYLLVEKINLRPIWPAHILKMAPIYKAVEQTTRKNNIWRMFLRTSRSIIRIFSIWYK